MATWDDVARIVADLRLTAEPVEHDWRVGKKVMVWERPLRPSDRDALGPAAPTGDILAARVADENVKAALITERPDVYFTTPHFDDYAVVLVRLSRIGLPELTELITEAWLAQAPKQLVKEYLANHSRPA